jgi:RND family efflux transporter MFP subunit
MKHNLKNSIPTLMILALAIGLAACRPAKDKAGAGVPVAVEATNVKAFRVIRQIVSEKISFTGTLEAAKKITITPETGGKIARIYVREGDRVKAGTLLAELETEAIRLQLRQAEAGLAVAQASFNDAAKNKERMDRLMKENAVSEQQTEKIQLAYDSAKAQFDQAGASVNLARYALGVSLMKAPFSGVIGAKNAEVGDVINPMMSSYGGASGVLTLMDLSKIKMVVDVPENDILRIRRGQTAALKAATDSSRTFTGEITVASITADPATKKFRVEAVFDNPDESLRPGTFGEVTFAVETRESALAVPQKAVLDKTHIFVVRDGKAVKSDVTLGLQNTTLVEVLSGIAEGDLVIVEGNYGLEDGAPVTITEEVK